MALLSLFGIVDLYRVDSKCIDLEVCQGFDPRPTPNWRPHPEANGADFSSDNHFTTNGASSKKMLAVLSSLRCLVEAKSLSG